MSAGILLLHDGLFILACLSIASHTCHPPVHGGSRSAERCVHSRDHGGVDDTGVLEE